MHAASHRSRSGRHASIANLARVLEDLAVEFPLLHSLVERRRGGQKRLPMPNGPRDGEFGPLFALARAADEPGESEPPLSRDAGSVGAPPPLDATEPEPDESPRPDVDTAALPGSHAPRRRAQYGLSLRFEARPDDDELGRLVDSTIWVNDAHPAFARATRSRSLGYHLALTVALALAPLAATPADEHLFVTRFLAEWGQVYEAGQGSTIRRRLKYRR